MANCQKIVHPLGKGMSSYQCRRPHYGDGWCKQHHPDIVKAKELDNERRQQEYQLQQREHFAERHKKLEMIEGSALTVDNAILLLVKNGYRVELIK